MVGAANFNFNFLNLIDKIFIKFYLKFHFDIFVSLYYQFSLIYKKIFHYFINHRNYHLKSNFITTFTIYNFLSYFYLADKVTQNISIE